MGEWFFLSELSADGLCRYAATAQCGFEDGVRERVAAPAQPGLEPNDVDAAIARMRPQLAERHLHGRWSVSVMAKPGSTDELALVVCRNEESAL